MGFYLFDNPPVATQWRAPRREPISGTVVWHNSGSLMDRSPPDASAENVAGFIRSDPGPHSYHELLDSDSLILMLPDDVEAFGVATGGNRWMWHICSTGTDGDFRTDDTHTRICIDKMAARTVEFWKRQGKTPRLDRFLNYDEAQNQRQVGVVHHGTLQPADRSDAWTSSSQRAQLDAYSLERLRAYWGGQPDPRKDPNVARNIILSNKDARGEELLLTKEGKLRQRWQDAAGKWSPWRDFQPPLPRPVVEIAGFLNHEGRLEVVARDADGWAARAWQTAPGGQWEGWGPT